MTLLPVDATNELAVSDYLTRARDWLATAVEQTGPEQIAAAKAEIATAAEATKQLGLSKEIQSDAQEMVRRAEYALGKAIRKGQAEGTIAKKGTGLIPGRGLGVDYHDTESPRPVTDFATRGELYGNARDHGVLDMADGLGPDDFDEVISAAKSEGNLSRANVARKAREAAGKPPVTAANPSRETTLVNDIRLYLRTMSHSKEIHALTPEARHHIVTALNNAATHIQEIR